VFDEQEHATCPTWPLESLMIVLISTFLSPFMSPFRDNCLEAASALVKRSLLSFAVLVAPPEVLGAAWPEAAMRIGRGDFLAAVS
jgi:hypothetical protein